MFPGKVLGEFEHGNFTATAAVVQSDNKLIAGGNFHNGKDNFALVRYNANGSVDNTFGLDGKVTGVYQLAY